MNGEPTGWPSYQCLAVIDSVNDFLSPILQVFQSDGGSWKDLDSETIVDVVCQRDAVNDKLPGKTILRQPNEFGIN